MKRLIGCFAPSRMRKSIPLLLLAAFIFFGIPQVYAQDLLKVYYVRHGEGGHNVVSEWKHKPKSEWPAYVGNPNVFTPKGEQQVDALTAPKDLKVSLQNTGIWMAEEQPDGSFKLKLLNSKPYVEK